MRNVEEPIKEISYRLKITISYIIIAIILICILVYLANEEIKKNSTASKEAYLLILVIMIAATVPIVALWSYTKELEEVFYNGYENYYLDKISMLKKGSQIDENEDQDLILEEKHDEDVVFNMLKNNREIRSYFKITKQQEVTSYVISIICAVFGVAILTYSVYAIFKNKNIEATIISVISGAITEVVSGIVLWIHNKSAMQLNYYYDALHENEKILSAINLADKLEKKEKEQMYMEIIKAQIKGSEKEEDNNIE